jgi:tripartite-type tricarboxylate transporter receptor subunit TctC
MVSYSISLVVVNASSPARNIADLAALARAQPGRLNYLRAGSGSFSHMSMELMQRAMGFQVTAVDYRGLPPGVVDLLAGRLDLAVLSTGIAMQHVREGRLRAIAAIGTSRAPEFPDVPTLTEQGVAEANLDSWYIAMAPRGVPEPVVARIADAYTRVLSRPAVADKLRAVGTVPARPIPPAEVQAVLAREYQKFATLIRDANIRAD